MIKNLFQYSIVWFSKEYIFKSVLQNEEPKSVKTPSPILDRKWYTVTPMVFSLPLALILTPHKFELALNL